MPREIALGGALVPTLIVVLVLSLLPLWLIDQISGRFGLYGRAWHPPLFRIALYVGIFGSVGLLFFQ
jgi:protein AaeX